MAKKAPHAVTLPVVRDGLNSLAQAVRAGLLSQEQLDELSEVCDRIMFIIYNKD